MLLGAPGAWPSHPPSPGQVGPARQLPVDTVPTPTPGTSGPPGSHGAPGERSGCKDLPTFASFSLVDSAQALAWLPGEGPGVAAGPEDMESGMVGTAGQRWEGPPGSTPRPCHHLSWF